MVCLVGQNNFKFILNSDNLDDCQPDSFVWGLVRLGLDFRVRFVTVRRLVSGLIIQLIKWANVPDLPTLRIL